MGRTNPTFRDALRAMETDWGAFRRGLRRRDREHFDSLFEGAGRYADAGGYMNAPDPTVAVLLSMLLAHEVELAEHRE